MPMLRGTLDPLVLILLVSLLGSAQDSNVPMTFFAGAVTACLLSVFAGVALLLGTSSGQWLSLCVQGLQCTQFSFGWCRFEFLVEPGALIGVSSGWHFRGVLTTAPSVQLQLGGWSEPYAAFNLFAIAAVMYLAVFYEKGARH